MVEPTFDQSDFIGGALALDFANTVAGDRDAVSKDRLADVATLIAWARAGNILDAKAERRLLTAARNDANAADETFQRALALREAIYAAFVAVARRSVPPAPAVSAIAAALADRLPGIALGSADARFTWTFPQGGELDAILGPIAANAFDLLTSATPDRIRQCDGVICGWLFYDTSKTGRRRWCDMRRGCGNRAKVQRHRERHRAQGATTA